MLFMGVDLAWSERNGSGIAVIEGDEHRGELRFGSIAMSDAEIAGLIQTHVGDQPALIAIDAPLIVPNEEGRRPADALVSKLFRKQHAGAYPANRKRLSQWSGKVRGEEISKLLEAQGFAQDPYIKRFEKARKFFEVYPHPSMVVLFELKKVIPYKKKQARDHGSIWRAFKSYQACLKSLESATPALTIPKEIIEKDVRGLKGQALKDYEDLLDAIFCAYIAYYCWAHPDRCAILGSMAEGYIMTPITESMKREVAAAQSRLKDF